MLQALIMVIVLCAVYGYRNRLRSRAWKASKSDLLVLRNDPFDRLMIASVDNPGHTKSTQRQQQQQRQQQEVVEFHAREVMAINEARHYIRKHMSSVLRCLTRAYDRKYRARFKEEDKPLPRLQWRQIREAANAKPKREEFKPGDRDEAIRLFLRNSLRETLEEHKLDWDLFFDAVDIEAPDWRLNSFDMEPITIIDDGTSLITLEGKADAVVNKKAEKEQKAAEALCNSAREVPYKQELIGDANQLMQDLEILKNSLRDDINGPDIIIRLSVLEQDFPLSVKPLLKKFETVILKTIPIIKRDEERKFKAISKRSPRESNPYKKRRGPRANKGDGVGGKGFKKKDARDNVLSQPSKAISWNPGKGRMTVPDYVDDLYVETDEKGAWI